MHHCFSSWTILVDAILMIFKICSLVSGVIAELSQSAFNTTQLGRLWEVGG